MNKYDKVIQKIPHFPKEGILFYDITGLFLNPKLFQDAVDEMAEVLKDKGIEVIAGLESRGFLFAAPLAYKLGIPFILVRKEGKLPRQTIGRSLELEYGSDVIEIHVEDIPQGKNIALIDDLLATGGTMIATKELMEKAGAKVSDVIVMIDLPFLKGREKLESKGVEVTTLLTYHSDEVKEGLK